MYEYLPSAVAVCAAVGFSLAGYNALRQYLALKKASETRARRLPAPVVLEVLTPDEVAMLSSTESASSVAGLPSPWAEANSVREDLLPVYAGLLQARALAATYVLGIVQTVAAGFVSAAAGYVTFAVLDGTRVENAALVVLIVSLGVLAAASAFTLGLSRWRAAAREYHRIAARRAAGGAPAIRSYGWVHRAWCER